MPEANTRNISITAALLSIAGLAFETPKIVNHLVYHFNTPFHIFEHTVPIILGVGAIYCLITAYNRRHPHY